MAYENALLAAADPTRQKILAALAGRRLTVGDIAAGLPVSRPAVSQHLKLLKDAGWVAEAREGTRHYFSVNPATALALRNHFETMWQHAMRAYAEHVAREESRNEQSRHEHVGHRKTRR
ncbi:MAG: metalloregulator ArsR/SmtB family transcription factor [Casimicrobiaceae bacterium]